MAKYTSDMEKINRLVQQMNARQAEEQQRKNPQPRPATTSEILMNEIRKQAREAPANTSSSGTTPLNTAALLKAAISGLGTGTINGEIADGRSE